MGEKNREALKLPFGKRLKLESHRSRVTSDAGLHKVWQARCHKCIIGGQKP